MVMLVPLVLLWGEMFTRLLLPQEVDSRMNIFVPDPVVGFTYMPEAKAYEKGREYNALYQINMFGLRDREYGPKKEGVFRVLLLGDSFSVSHGLPIEESLSRRMESALQGVADQDGKLVKFEVVNSAVGGYSPYNYWEAYRRWAPVFKPDIVLVGLSPDDFDCGNENLRYLIENGETLALSRPGEAPWRSRRFSITKLRKWLSWNSELYVLMRNFLYYNDISGRVSLWMSAREEAQRTQLEQYIVPQPERMKRAWAKSFSYLRKLKDEASADGIMLVLMPIPLKLEIDTKAYLEALAAGGLTPRQVDIGQPLKLISAFCKVNDVPVFDPRPAIREHHANQPCYFVYDGHWNSEGILAATASLARQWQESGLRPWNNALKGEPRHRAFSRVISGGML
jgi:hypothetical protein